MAKTPLKESDPANSRSVRINGRSVTRQEVLTVIDEYRMIGGDAFIWKHGFGVSHRYLLEFEGLLFYSKAVFGTAAGLGSKQLNGGSQTTSPLEALGFTIVDLKEIGVERLDPEIQSRLA